MEYLRYCLIVVAFFGGFASGEGEDGMPTTEEMQAGFKLASKASESVCWYEYLKSLPNFKEPKTNKFGTCYLNLRVERLIEIWAAKNFSVNNYMFIKTSVGANMNKFIKQFLPQKYYDDCRKYMVDPMSDYDEQHPLVAAVAANKIPYRSWSNCILFSLEELHGVEAAEALKTKWSEEQKPWTEVILARENENRARHGSPPLEMEPEIQESAQKLADELVAACGNYSTVIMHHDNTYQDEPCGLSIYLWNVGKNSPPDNDALQTANVWYESGQYYPWPVYTGDGTDPAFQQFGQFTQSMWKATEKAGYGMGKADTCNFTIIVGKYFPRGNILEGFEENVLPLPAE